MSVGSLTAAWPAYCAFWRASKLLACAQVNCHCGSEGRIVLAVRDVNGETLMSSADRMCAALMGGPSSVAGCGQVFGGLPNAFGDAGTAGAGIEGLRGGCAGEVEETARAVKGIATRLRVRRRVERGQRAGVDLLDEPREPASNAREGPRHQRGRSAPHVGS